MAHRGRDGRPVPDGETLRRFLDHGPVVAFIQDPSGSYLYRNAEMARAQEGGADFSDGAAGPGWSIVRFTFDDPEGRQLTGGLAFGTGVQQAPHEQLAESERRYRHLVETAQGLICTHDMTGRLLSVNQAALSLTGLSAAQAIGQNLRDLLSSPSREEFSLYLERIDHVGTDEGLMFIRAADGRELVWKYRNVKVAEPGHAPYILGHAQDVTELRTAQEQLTQLAMSDDLTALHNRRGFFVYGSRLLADVVKHGRNAAVFYADINELKSVNDSHGHDAGSALIVSAASVLQNSFRAADVLARVGGDEFVVLAVVPPGDVGTILKRLSWHMHKFNATSDLPYTLSMSIGTVSFDPSRHTTLESLVKEADTAMYRLKRADGRLPPDASPA